jgi:SAM-dependent methyltransferase
MAHQPYENNEIQGREPDNILTKPEDWGPFFLGRQFEQIERLAHRPSLIDDYLKTKTGKLFELGCGGSRLLARSALLGWEVGGIDFNAEALRLIQDYLAQKNYDNKNLVCGDILSYDCSQFHNKYDLLVSFGVLEHFRDPQPIMFKWKRILSRDGIVITYLPNLFSINAFLMRKYAPDVWAQHHPFSPQDMDQFHIDAGLVPLRGAQYVGPYDINMLVPWSSLQHLISNRFVFKTLKCFAYYGVGKVLRLLPNSNMKLLNSFLLGVYVNP